MWTPDRPPPLEKLLSGSGAVSAGLTSPGRNGSSSTRRTSSFSSTSRITQAWVRRRRWVRVMRRRLDIPPLPFLKPDGSMYHLDGEGSLIPYVPENASEGGDEDGQELGFRSLNRLSSDRDYVARARYLVGVQSWDGDETDPVSARRAIAKLERATTELRQGVLSELV
jgi:hypothetical protein